MHDWLTEVRYKGYIILVERVILGDMENSDLFSYIILTCKKIIYNATKTDK